MNRDLLGDASERWLGLGRSLPPGCLRMVLADVDGVITRGEGQPVDIEVLQRLAAINAAAQLDPYIPAITLCTGRQAPYVELMAQLTDVFLPCIFEQGAGLFFPAAHRYDFDPRLGPDYSAKLARLRAALEEPLLRPGRAFVQPGKEASMSLYPLGKTSLDALVALTEAIVARVAPDFTVDRNVKGVELRPRGIDKGSGGQRIGETLELSVAAMAGVGDSDPDLSFLNGVGIGFSAAPSNATEAVRKAVDYVAESAFGAGLLEIIALVETRNRQQTVTDT